MCKKNRSYAFAAIPIATTVPVELTSSLNYSAALLPGLSLIESNNFRLVSLQVSPGIIAPVLQYLGDRRAKILVNTSSSLSLGGTGLSSVIDNVLAIGRIVNCYDVPIPSELVLNIREQVTLTSGSSANQSATGIINLCPGDTVGLLNRVSTTIPPATLTINNFMITLAEI